VLRIQQSREGDTVVLTLSGRIDTEHVGELQRIVESHRGTHLILDLTDVSLVDREAITMLAAFEDAGAELREGPAYVLEWIRNEHGKPSGGFES
jgi:anti-anti-sigma regulatory factor